MNHPTFKYSSGLGLILALALTGCDGSSALSKVSAIQTLSPADRDRPLSDFRDEITLEITDADTFNDLANAGVYYLYENGQKTPESNFSNATDFCTFDMTSGTAHYKKGDRISFKVSMSSSEFSANTSDRTLTMICMKLSDPSGTWALKDLDEVLSGLATVVSAK